MEKKIKYLVGIDEAGRGPLAGPVAIGVVLIPADFEWAHIPGVGDSKKVSVKNREAIFHRAHKLKVDGFLNFDVSLIGASVINEKGISYALRQGIESSLQLLNVDPRMTEILLDGALRAPQTYTHQKTIVKGDQTEQVIGLASILAKVTRDGYMCALAQKFPEYQFDIHKGYGTVLHRSAIQQYGMCPEHRTLFCRRTIGE